MGIKVVRFVSGDEIMCEVERDGEDYVLKNSHQVSMVPSRNGQPAFGMLPYPITSSDKQIRVNEKFVMIVCEPGEEFLAQYKSITGVGIVVPPKDIILA